MSTKVDKKLILSGFTSQFKELMDDLSRIFPNDVDIKTGKTALSLLLKTNPKKLIETWKNRVVPYNKEIEGDEISFFINKDYRDDVNSLSKDTILEAIERLRGPINNMNSSNKEKTMAYLKNLTKLTILYYE